MGYATGQFGKNHLGDLNEFLPTVHGFDEFFGYLYHLDAMEDPCASELSAGPAGQGRPAQHGPLAGRPTRDDPTVMPRWGKVGKQKIEDAGTLYPKRMETVDDEIRDLALKFIDKAKADGKPFFLWLNPTRMHVVTHLSPTSTRRCATPRTAGRIQEAGMAQLDDDRRLGDEEAQGHGRRRQHHRRLHHRQRHRDLHLAGRRPDAVRAAARARSWKAASACRR